MKKQTLILEQIDRKLVILKKIDDLTIPPSGWIYAIRQALGMSLRQLGNKMKITPQSVKDMEDREKNGTISLNVLKQFGQSLEMKFVYGFIPKHGSLEELIEQRAFELAKDIVSRTSQSMKLEDQENNSSRIQKAIQEKAVELKQVMPKYLWD